MALDRAQKEQLRRLLLDKLRKACKESKKFGYNPSYFIEMLQDRDADEVAELVILKDPPPTGFSRLLLNKRLDLSTEHIILTGEWKELFDFPVLEKARERLDECGHSYTEWYPD